MYVVRVMRDEVHVTVIDVPYICTEKIVHVTFHITTIYMTA